MKVILLADVKKVGKKGELVEVSDGYGRNFLIRQGLAVAASAKSLDVLKEENRQEAEKQAELKKEAEALKAELEKTEIVFRVKAKGGKVSNSVSTKKIEEELAKRGYKIDKRKILDSAPLSSLGYNIVRVELYKDVIASFKVKLEEEI
ncbi:MAG: 50S ribosomal protein L9 [Erysipelotrichaceae bacterium]|nr:50S ribosomal protein L9 [Erysipelotrichaceae bacterium]MBR2552020.1 50S ribosomal protein L9 [Erysipelotrichaceae bacterium]MBR4122119.1 50S ribosomal protein L9 [Erysipelotrichaceae bacterium]